MTKAKGAEKPFTAQIQRRKERHSAEDASLAGFASSQGAVQRDLQEIKDELRFLGHMLRAYLEPDPPLPPDKTLSDVDPSSSPIVSAYERQKDELRILRTELKALANSIQQTKREIARLRSKEEADDRLNLAASELDAVVGATETATNGILGEAEKIDSVAQTLKSQASDEYVGRLAEEIVESVMAIFEHCNFQDITGQRIAKVVNALKFVEARVEKMMDIWGRDSFDEIRTEDVEEEKKDEESKLLNGPALEHQAVSQADIDRLFD